MVFSETLKESHLIHKDLETQFLEFDSIIPFEKQTCMDIYSPRLVNMLLTTCPQIESICVMLNDHMKITKNGNIPALMEEINRNKVLEKIVIYSKFTKKKFFPFKNLDW